MDAIKNLSEDAKDDKSRGKKLLDEFKAKEKTIKFFERKIGKNTIVYCKNKERLDEYEESYNNIRNW